MRFSHRFFLYGPFLMLVALASGVMVYWWIAASALSHKLDALNGHEILPGVRMSFASKMIGGFPFRLDTTFNNLVLETSGAHGPLVWHANQLASHTLTYSSGLTIFEAGGPQVITWTGENGSERRLTLTQGALRASAIIGADKLERFDLDAISIASSRWAAGRAQFHIRRDPNVDALDLVADLEALRIAGDTAAGFPEGLSHVRLEGRLAPSGPFTQLLAGRTDWRQSLDGWRMKGGFLKVDQAALFWRKCQATSSGDLAFDDAHRIAGALSFSIADCDDLSRQAKSVTAQSRAHRAILTVLASLAAVEPPDQNGALSATVAFKDGIVFIGPGKSLGANSPFEPVGLLHTLY